MICNMKSISILMILLVSLIGFSANAGVYEFQKLYQQLGYPSPNNFGATDEEFQDLETYTSKEDSFYKEINSYLRYFPQKYEWNGISPQDAQIMVKHIDHIFDLVPTLPSKLILFRGIDLKFRQNKSYQIGDEFVEKAYASTSTSFKVAHYFAVEMDAEERPTSKKAIFTLYINRPNFKGILFDQGEDEIILKHGEKIRIMAIKNKNRLYDFYLAQICSKICEIKPNKEALKVFNKL